MARSSIIAETAPQAVDAAEVRLEPVDDRGREIVARQLREHHWTMLVVAILVIAASLALRLPDTETVGLKWLHISLPPMCGSRALLGVECPGCGLTRSFVALAAGDFQQSLRFHRVGWLLAAAVAGQIPYRLYALCEIRSRIIRRAWPVWFGYFLIAALIGNWVVNMWNR